MKKILHALQRPIYFLAAVGLLTGLAGGVAAALASGGQVQSRSLRMSDASPSGNAVIPSGEGSGTNVTYRVTFTVPSTNSSSGNDDYTIKGVVLDFCSGGGTPFMGDSNCPAPSSFTVGTTPTIDTTSYTDSSGTITGLGSGWTAGSLNSGQTFYMTNSTGVALTHDTTYTFAITGVTNPSTVGTFYARLMTYTDTTSPPAYTHAAPGSYQDYGGFALSTANVVTVTAKVQEAITFCVSGTALSTDCSSATTPAITLGHGTNNTLDSSQVDTAPVYTFESTNAQHGLAIRIRNANACGGLSTDGGTTCSIPAVNSGGSTPAAIGTSAAGFGLHCADGSGGTGTVTADPNYNDGTASHYGMDTTTTYDNVTTTFGDVVATSAGPVSGVSNTLTFAAQAAPTTPAGIYTANMALIATGTF